MALRAKNATASIRRTSNLVAANVDYCCCAWFQPTFELAELGPKYITAWVTHNAAYTGWAGLFSDSSVNPQTYEVHTHDGTTPAATANHRIQANRKLHLGYRRSGTSHFFYVNALLVGSVTKNIAGLTFTDQWLLHDQFGVVDADLLMWDFKEWNSSKSVFTLQRAMWTTGSIHSSDTANLWAYLPLVSDLNDVSGNNRHFVGTGSGYDFVAQPSMPSNLSPANPTPIVFNTTPTTLTEELEASFVSIPRFYSWVNNTGRDVVISLGVWASLANPASSGYTPHHDGWLEPELNNTNIHDGFIEGSSTFPLPVGKTFILQVQDEDALNVPFAPATLNIQTLRGPEGKGLAGDVFIRCASFGGGPDIGEVPEYIGLHGGFIRPAEQRILGYIPFFPTGETGDVFPASGRFIFADEGGSWDGFTTDGGLTAYWFYIFDTDLKTVITRAAVASPQLPPIVQRMHQPSGLSYQIGNHAAGVKKYSTIDENGNKSADVTLTGISSATAVAVNNAGTILYVGVSGAIKRWSIPGAVFLADLASAVANHSVSDLLVMPDDSIIASYFKSTVTRAAFVRRYTDGGPGTITHTYTPTFADVISSITPRLGYSFNATPSFWYFNHLDNPSNKTDLRRLQASDLTLLVGPSLTSDVNESDERQANPPIPYTSDSCPVVELKVDAPNSGGFEEVGAAGDCARENLSCWGGPPPTLQCIDNPARSASCWSGSPDTSRLSVGPIA